MLTRPTYVLATLLQATFQASASRRLAASLSGAVILGIVAALPSTTPHVQISPTLAAGSPWLDRLNLWRTTSGLPSVTANAVWSDGDLKHSTYMVKNDLVTHYETVGVPYYTVEGDTAAKNSNIFVSSSTSLTDEQAIDWWMQAPFHAIGIMDPRLTQSGYGSYREVKTGWQAGATLDVLRGNPFSGGTYPVYFPGNGSTEPLRTFDGNESPNPLQACAGYTAPTGLPVFVEVGGNVATTAGPVHSFVGNGVALEHCVIDSNTPSVGSSLTGRGGVIVIPKQPLQTGITYSVALTVNGLPYTWSFTVGPFPTATPPPAGWQSLGGTLSSSPAASSWGPTRTDIFVRGSDNGLWHRSRTGATWSAWESLGGVMTADPSAVSWGTNRIDVVVRGFDYALWHRSFDGTTWSSWDKLGGYATSAPAVASWGPNRLDVIVTGTNNRGLWQSTWNGTSWAWTSLGGSATSDPGAVSSSANRIDVFVAGTDNHGLWHNTWNGTSWTWTSLGGVALSGPNATSCTAGHVDMFVTGTDAAIWQRGFNGTSWAAWKSLGGTWTSRPSAVCPPGSVAIDVFARGTDNALWIGPATGS